MSGSPVGRHHKMFSAVAPRKNAWSAHTRPFARASLSASASGDVVGGFVFGISQNPVTPPAIAASEPVDAAAGGALPDLAGGFPGGASAGAGASAAVDSVGICDFAQSGLAAPGGIENVYQMVAAKSGQPFGEEDWQALGLRVLKAERAFNRRAGFTPADDRLPRMFYEEPLPPHNKVVVISDAEMEATFDF